VRETIGLSLEDEGDDGHSIGFSFLPVLGLDIVGNDDNGIDNALDISHTFVIDHLLGHHELAALAYGQKAKEDYGSHFLFLNFFL
jgi:hypothetical protein